MLPFELTKDTPYLALSGELWSVFYEYFNRNWSCYKEFLLYLYSSKGNALIYYERTNNCYPLINNLLFFIYRWSIHLNSYHSIYRYLWQCWNFPVSLHWRHNGLDGSNHQPHHCLLSRLFGRKSKKTSKLRVTGLCAGFHRGPVNSPQKWPVTWKMVPFDDAIMVVSRLIIE